MPVTNAFVTAICQRVFFVVRWGHGRIHHNRELQYP